MIYPKNYEAKVGFDEIRTLLKGKCLSELGRARTDLMTFSKDCERINEWFEQIKEFRKIREEEDDFPMNYFFDVRESVARIRLEGTYMEENELFDLRRSLDTINQIVAFLTKSDDDTHPYPALFRLARNVATFPNIISRIDQILDKFGKIKDSASTELASIRSELRKTEGSISRTLYNILKGAQSEGVVDKDVAPTLRDGRLVIPVAPGLKRKIKGIVHDESASGKTVFIEPAEVVEANNRIRELESDERREIIRILISTAAEIRPHVIDILHSYRFLGEIDFIQAKSAWAESTEAFEPEVEDKPYIDWIRAIHPLLQISLEKQGKSVVPLDIVLTKEKRILIISGPNAGGKSVCLKTVGLLQYMIQCGVSVPISYRSKVGVFSHIMIDIGDEQSIENDLSTYSSHLMNMKMMMRQADGNTLLLIDEFGTGTEPQIGGAIAESVLKQFWKKQAFGVITTHYQNLKHFAEGHDGVVNGAMLYDRHEMQALFQLAIGQPGSSFAIEIARKTGIPEEVIRDASEIVGSEYIQSDKYLQDIVRDKRYWEGKRQTIHQQEKKLDDSINKYEQDITDLNQQRKAIIQKAKQEAEELLKEANRRIENTIREIKEKQAEKEETKRIRDEFNAYRNELAEAQQKEQDEKIAKKIAQIQQRKERQEKRKKEKAEKKAQQESERSAAAEKKKAETEIKTGDTVRIKGLTTVGKVESIDEKTATVIFGDMKTKMPKTKLEHAEPEKRKETIQAVSMSRITREAIDDRKLNFKQDLDVRGMRGDEAINAVTHFIDDAILVGMSRVRILHGKGNGILRQLIRQYLATIPNVTAYKDEHVQFGGSGITVVDIG